MNTFVKNQIPYPILFLSLSEILIEMANNALTDQELENGLFYLGCTREIMAGPLQKSYKVKLAEAFPNQAEATAALDRLRKALIKAEEEERIEWWNPVVAPTYRKLNELLQRFDLGRIPDESDGAKNYNLREVAEQANKASLSLVCMTNMGRMGFLCPPELLRYWSQSECTVERTTDNTFIVLDHSIQTTVFAAYTQAECAEFLHPE